MLPNVVTDAFDRFMRDPTVNHLGFVKYYADEYLGEKLRLEAFEDAWNLRADTNGLAYKQDVIESLAIAIQDSRQATIEFERHVDNRDIKPLNNVWYIKNGN